MNVTQTLKAATARGLIYLGYFLGIILVLEGIAKYIREEDPQVLYVFFISIFIWGMGYIKRRKISRQVLNPRYATTEAYTKIEFMYFLISYTFVALFAATLLRYLPTEPVASVERLEGLEDYSRILVYTTQVMPFNLIIKMLIFFVIFLGMLALSQVVFTFFMRPGQGYPSDFIKQRNTRIMSLIGTMLFSFFLMQTRFIQNFVFGSERQAIDYLQTNFQWLVDYIMGSPIFYYLYITFSGSEILEEFSLFKRFI